MAHGRINQRKARENGKAIHRFKTQRRRRKAHKTSYELTRKRNRPDIARFVRYLFLSVFSGKIWNAPFSFWRVLGPTCVVSCRVGWFDHGFCVLASASWVSIHRKRGESFVDAYPDARKIKSQIHCMRASQSRSVEWSVTIERGWVFQPFVSAWQCTVKDRMKILFIVLECSITSHRFQFDERSFAHPLWMHASTMIEFDCMICFPSRWSLFHAGWRGSADVFTSFTFQWPKMAAAPFPNLSTTCSLDTRKKG